jgi:hypothetical protein
MKRHQSLSAVVIGVLLLAFSSWAFFIPLTVRRYDNVVATKTITRLYSALEDDSDEQSSEKVGTDANFFSQAKQLGTKAGSDVMSVANAAVSSLEFVAGAASSGMNSAAGGISKLTAKGGSTVKTVAKTGIKSVTDAAFSIAEKTGTGAKSVVSVAGSGIKTVASSTAAGIGGLAQKGGSDAITLVQWLDSQAKNTASSAKNRTSAATTQAKSIARKLIEVTCSSDYKISDILLLLKVLLAIGASFGPLAKILPVTVLLQMLNVSLEARLGGKILEVLAESLDERFVAAITAEELGDLAKRSLTGAILAFTGKESYEAGDIERAVTSDYSNGSHDNAVEQKTLALSVGPEFAQWDEAFRERHPNVEFAIAESLDARQNTSGVNSKPLDASLIREMKEWDDILAIWVANKRQQ